MQTFSAEQVGITIVTLALLYWIVKLGRRLRWERKFPEIFGNTISEATTEQVFSMLQELRMLAEKSDPRFSRAGFKARGAYLGWLDIADANWNYYYKAKTAATVCKFL